VEIRNEEIYEISENNVFMDSLGNNLIEDFAYSVSEVLSPIINEYEIGFVFVGDIILLDLSDNAKLNAVRNYTFAAIIIAWNLIPVTLIVLAFMKEKRYYIVSLIGSLLSAFFMGSIVLLVPFMTRKALSVNIENLSSDSSYEKYQNTVLQYLGKFTRELIFKSISVGFWIFIVLALAVAILSAVGLITYKSDEPAKEKAATYVPHIQILSGEYDGASIDIGDGIVIGRDVNKCQLILSGEEVSRVHCIISYNRETNHYLVTDRSTNGTYILNGKRLTENVPTDLEKGTIITIGKKGDTIRLS
jgi:hypothetical protein